MLKDTIKTNLNIHGVRGTGCFSVVLTFIGIWFFCAWLVNSCESGHPWNGAVQTVKEYKTIADSIWNE